jgi:hypothetical protein
MQQPGNNVNGVNGAHHGYVMGLMSGDQKRMMYRQLNLMHKSRLNGHDWDHILRTISLFEWLCTVAQRCGQHEWILPLDNMDYLEFKAIGLDAIIHHDLGMGRGPREGHCQRSWDILWEDRDFRRRAGLTDLAQEIVRLLVRNHGGTDFLVLEQILSDKSWARKCYRLLKAGSSVADVLKIRGIVPPTRHPSRDDVIRFIEIELGGECNGGLPPIPILFLLALVVGADTGDFGQIRVQDENRHAMELILPYAKNEPGRTVYDHMRMDLKDLRSHGYPSALCELVQANPWQDRETDLFEVTGNAMRRTTYALENVFHQRIEKMLFQAQNINGEFVGVAKTAREVDEGRCPLEHVFDPSPWLTTFSCKRRQPTRLILEYEFDPRMCSHKLFRKQWGKYLDELKGVARVIGLQGVIVAVGDGFINGQSLGGRLKRRLLSWRS